MEINKLSQAMNVARYETNSPKASKEGQTLVDKGVGQQDKLEISKEALAAAEKGNAQLKSILKMSQEERAELVSRLKDKMEQDRAKLFDFVRNTLAGQGNALAEADDVWKFIASGKYEVGAETKAKAQEAISEDGNYGVKQVSERIFNFALALTGGNQEQMRKMESAFEDGFKEATKSWGKELPEISKQTYDAVKEKFAKFYGEEIDV